jgi:hypothetical protein
VRGAVALVLLALSACATPRLHSVEQLNAAGLNCGLALGELIQDEEEKKLLIMFRPGASAEQKACVSRWARRNHLKAVIIDQIEFSGS